jgi:hypothetical protein
MIVSARLNVKAKDAAFSWRSATGRACAAHVTLAPRLAGHALARLLHCIKFDNESARINPNAKKYRSAVSFLVAAIASGV